MNDAFRGAVDREMRGRCYRYFIHCFVPNADCTVFKLFACNLVGRVIALIERAYSNEVHAGGGRAAGAGWARELNRKQPVIDEVCCRDAASYCSYQAYGRLNVDQHRANDIGSKNLVQFDNVVGFIRMRKKNNSSRDKSDDIPAQARRLGHTLTCSSIVTREIFFKSRALYGRSGIVNELKLRFNILLRETVGFMGRSPCLPSPTRWQRPSYRIDSPKRENQQTDASLSLLASGLRGASQNGPAGGHPRLRRRTFGSISRRQLAAAGSSSTRPRPRTPSPSQCQDRDRPGTCSPGEKNPNHELTNKRPLFKQSSRV
ncbi:hypothetical protein EVAR_94160_1 [Eumeta japonica]|uniref:Uncharacterized protein n=1 Tax=Eumeta variegata TaxID=151549 RepID=A0A4C1U780_EUMVA|nr:hypothetical protein EVAR_94160_1 [Eumeta japonica]